MIHHTFSFHLLIAIGLVFVASSEAAPKKVGTSTRKSKKMTEEDVMELKKKDRERISRIHHNASDYPSPQARFFAIHAEIIDGAERDALRYEDLAELYQIRIDKEVEAANEHRAKKYEKVKMIIDDLAKTNHDLVAGFKELKDQAEREAAMHRIEKLELKFFETTRKNIKRKRKWKMPWEKPWVVLERKKKAEKERLERKREARKKAAYNKRKAAAEGQKRRNR